MQEDTPGAGKRRPSAGREREEGEAEIKKGSQRDGVWEGWPWAGETPGLRWGSLWRCGRGEVCGCRTAELRVREDLVGGCLRGAWGSLSAGGMAKGFV